MISPAPSEFSYGLMPACGIIPKSFRFLFQVGNVFDLGSRKWPEGLFCCPAFRTEHSGSLASAHEVDVAHTPFTAEFHTALVEDLVEDHTGEGRHVSAGANFVE